MKTRDYSLYKKVTDAEGHDHFITVVGRLVLSKEDTTVTLPAIVETENGKSINGMIVHPLKRNRRELTMAYSICHPNDEFNEEEGKKIAMHRLKTNPIGSMSSYNVTMLNDDAINLLLFGECNYIANHLDKYIKSVDNEEENSFEIEIETDN